jgi:hypothetical protein
MPFVTPKQVMEAVFNKTQQSAIMTMVRHHCHDEKWQDTPVDLSDAMYDVEKYRSKSTAKCLTTDARWRARLITTDFWRMQAANMQWNNDNAQRLERQLTNIQRLFTEAAKRDPRLNEALLRLQAIRIPVDRMPDLIRQGIFVDGFK